MDKKSSSSITEFDALYTTNQMQILKILLPFLSPDMQRSMAIYIKFTELKLALEQSTLSGFVPFTPKPFMSNIEPIYEEITPFLSLSQRETLSKAKDTFKSFQDIKDTMEIFQMMLNTSWNIQKKHYMKV